MKKVKTQKVVIEYVCEHCNKTYASQYNAEDCERRHKMKTCLHTKNKTYSVEHGDYESFIVLQCIDCNYKTIAKWSLSDLDSQRLEKVADFLETL